MKNIVIVIALLTAIIVATCAIEVAIVRTIVDVDLTTSAPGTRTAENAILCHVPEGTGAAACYNTKTNTVAMDITDSYCVRDFHNILLHETVHAVDYHNVAPYADTRHGTRYATQTDDFIEASRGFEWETWSGVAGITDQEVAAMDAYGQLNPTEYLAVAVADHVASADRVVSLFYAEANPKEIAVLKAIEIVANIRLILVWAFIYALVLAAGVKFILKVWR